MSKPCTEYKPEFAHEINLGGSLAEPKHLRVGIDSAQVNDAALVRLLVEKGFITLAEYQEAIRREANREVLRLEARHQINGGPKISFR